MTLVQISGLTQRYPGMDVAALDGVDLTIAPGQMLALLGPSGCGKTTALQIIAGLQRATAGRISFDGQRVDRLSPNRRGAVLMFQDPLLFGHMDVAQNVGFGLRMQRLPAPEVAARVAEMLALVHLHGLADRRPADLSGGQAQRVALARALILRPRLLLLDEPLSSLDAHLRAEMRDLILTLHRQLGLTTILVTHDQAEAVIIADQIGLLLAGRLVHLAPPLAFFAAPPSETVARFFGGQNFLAGRVSGGQFLCAVGALALPRGQPDGPGLLTIRPEAILFGPGAPNLLMAEVTGLQFLGSQTRVGLRVRDVTLTALVAPAVGATLTGGQMTPVTLPPAALWVMR